MDITLTIIGTLALAALAMGIIIRYLQAAHAAEMQQKEAEAHAREAQLRAIGDNLPDGMMYRILCAPDGAIRFLYVSAGIQRLSGVSAEAVLSDSSLFNDLIFPEDRAVFLAAWQKSLADRLVFQVVVRICRADGLVRWMQMSSAPQRLPDGRFAWDGIATDVTERKLAEQKQKQSEERFSRMFNHSPLPIALTRFDDGTVTDVNESFLSMSGFTRDEIIGRTSLELGFYPGQNDRKYIVEYLKKYGHLHAYEQGFRTKSGQLRQHVLWMDVITIDGQKHILALALDVTEKKLAERQQKQLEEQLRQTQKLEALGTLAGGIAHDFNNILGAIISFSELARMDNPDNVELQENLGEVLKASNRATHLVRQILSFSRRQKHERKILQLAGVVQEALKLLRATLPATIDIRQSIDDDLPAVLANPTQIHQVLMNLATNSAHAMKERQGRLHVALNRLYLDETDPRPQAELAAGDYVRLAVSDTGSGMDEATLKRVFEPFFTTKGPGEGTGLGLSVVHGIIKEHDGVIGVESEPGRGTTFTIYLPARAAVAAPELLDNSVIPRGNGERVLFVDDEVMLGEVAQKIIRRLGYQAVIFQNPGEAWEALQKDPAAYDILISDLTMPVMTGVDLARRALQLRPNLPIILTSGSSGTFSKAEVHEIGIRELMSKPLDYHTLAAALNKVLRPAPKLK
jgi:PAS domain S-box-containing protein